MKIFGLNHLSNKIGELLKKDVQHKSNPEKWNWKPHKPEKIRNLESIALEESKTGNYAAITNYTPSSEKQNILLIFHIGFLNHGFLTHLEKEGLKYVFIDFMQFFAIGKVKIVIDQNQEKKILQIDNVELDLNDVKVVIYNPPQFPYPLIDFRMIPKKKGRHQFLFEKRWSQLLKDLILLVPKDTVWLPGNPLNGAQEWQNKLGEYNLAKNMGFNIPPLIVTNDADELKAFSAIHGDTLLLREFSTPPFSFPPIKVNVSKISLENLDRSPSFFQKYIEKEYELRVVVIMDKVFPCKIYSQNSELAKDDWRVYDDANVKWELVDLPLDITKKLVAFVKEIGLTWASVDMIFSTDKKYYFLEANRPGASYWLDLFVGLDTTDEIIKLIKEKPELKIDKIIEETEFCV